MVESRNGLHDITFLTSVLRHAFSSVFRMADVGRFYVLGPPVQDTEQVTSLVLTVIRQISGLDINTLTLQNLEGPLRYDASWVAGARNALRRGMEAADLWTGQVVWSTLAVGRSF